MLLEPAVLLLHRLGRLIEQLATPLEAAVTSWNADGMPDSIA